jgi:ribosomal protein L10
MPTVQEIIDVYDAFMLEIAQAQTESEAIQTVENNAKAQAQNIPAWASWTESEALNWHDTNIAAKLPVASLTEANVLLTVLETENRALVRMVIALRNKIFPDLEGN